MRYKTLLLGTATAILAAGGTVQAADLSIGVAEPVDYVRVCDAFGVGFWYIPGTDTCLKIGGFVRAEAYFGEGVGNFNVDDGFLFNDNPDVEAHDGDWRFQTTANLQVTASSMTDWGPLIAYLEFEGVASRKSKFGSGEGDVILDPDVHDDVGYHPVELAEAYLSLGPLLAGYTQSLFDIGGGGYTYNGLDLSDTKVNQFRLSWAMNGFGLAVGLEDGSAERWGTDHSQDFPDIVAALTAGGAGFDAGVSAMYVDLASGGAWAVEGYAEVDVFGNSLKGVILWHDSALGGDLVGDDWAALASYRHNWASNLYSAITLQWPDTSEWSVAFNTVYSPVVNFSMGGEVVYDDDSGDWVGRIRLQRDFGE